LPAVHEALGEWCARWLGSPVDEVLFETGFLSAVSGVRLADGRSVVIKVRRPAPRLQAAYLVHRHVWQCGYPAPEPLVPPTPLGTAECATAERLLPGGEGGGRGPDDAARSAEALAWLIRVTASAGEIGSLSPSPPWVAWDHAGPGLWPDTDAVPGNLNDMPGPGWLDTAAAIFPSTGGAWQTATIQESEQFLAAYIRASSRDWTRDDIEAFWAASVWTRAFDTKEAAATRRPA
jgi:hypothetical protein